MVIADLLQSIVSLKILFGLAADQTGALAPQTSNMMPNFFQVLAQAQNAKWLHKIRTLYVIQTSVKLSTEQQLCHLQVAQVNNR